MRNLQNYNGYINFKDIFEFKFNFNIYLLQKLSSVSLFDPKSMQRIFELKKNVNFKMYKKVFLVLFTP